LAEARPVLFTYMVAVTVSMDEAGWGLNDMSAEVMLSSARFFSTVNCLDITLLVLLSSDIFLSGSMNTLMVWVPAGTLLQVTVDSV